MNKEYIKNKYRGMFGIFTHDMYKSNNDEYANGFIKAFKTWKDAFNFAKAKGKNTAIHLI